MEAGESGDVKIDRNEINSYEIVPMPDCSDNSHRTQGIWYYVTDIKNDVNNPYGQYYPRSGNRFAIDCMMNVHTSGLFTGSANQWIYTPCHGPFSLSLEVVGVYGDCVSWGDKKIYVYDWARNANCDSPGFKLIGSLSTMGDYKTSIDDGFGNTQTYIHVINSTRYLPSTQKWINEVYFFNYATPAGSWDLKYSYEYPDYDLLGYTWCDGNYHSWGNSSWAGVMEWSHSTENPLPLKEVAFKDLKRIFNNYIQSLNSSIRAFKQDLIPQGNVNRNYIAWTSYYTWRCGSSLNQD